MSSTVSPRHRSKTLATWIGLFFGSFGLHRVYVNGWGDPWAWLFPWPTLAGLYGLDRMLALGQDDRLAVLLTPLLGLMIAIGMLGAIVYGLTPDERWNERFNSGGRAHRSGWGTVFGLAVALLVGTGVLMTTIAFSGQRYFESQVEEGRKISQ